jgi:hypothetical protein
MGDKKLPGIATEDIGKCAYGIVRRGQEWIGKTIGMCHPTSTAASVSLELMISATCFSSSATSMTSSAARNVDLARALNPSLQTFDAWLAQNTSRIPLEEL